MNLKSSVLRFFGSLTLILFCLASHAATITGTVTGPDGLVADVIVKAYQSEDDVAAETTTDNNGEYILELPPEGAAWLEAEFPGLLGERVENVDLSFDREIRLFLFQEVTISGTAELPPELLGNVGVRFFPVGSFRGEVIANVDGGGSFEADALAGAYSIIVTPACDFLSDDVFTCFAATYFSQVGVDASEGSVIDVVVPEAEPNYQIFPDRSPIAELISVGAPDEGGIATITGAPGAADGVASIAVMNLQTSQFNIGASKADGSFSIELFAPPGSWLSVHRDPTGEGNFGASIALAAATMIRVPPEGEPGKAFAALERIRFIREGGSGDFVRTIGRRDQGSVWLGGELADRQWSPSEQIDLEGTAIVYSMNTPDTDPGSVDIGGAVFLERIFDPSGKQEIANPEFMSHFLTPSGFPIEKRTGGDPIWVGNIEFDPLAVINDRSMTAAWTADLNIPADTPDGIYQLVLDVDVNGIPDEKLHFEGVFPTKSDHLFSVGAAAHVQIGNVAPRRLSFALAVNELSNGSRGAVATEDEDRFALATHVSTSSQYLILERENPRTGARFEYRLEPYVPLVAASNRGWLSPPTIPFKFPSGSLKVKITRPDGSVENLGSAAFAQAFAQMAANKRYEGLAAGSNIPSQYYGLTTLKDKFRVSFEQYGRHEISMTGTIEDIQGNLYEGGGTYVVWIARHLDLETGVFPGTPFEAGDNFSPTVIVQPGVAANVEIRVRQYPNSDPTQMTEKTFKGKANRFGFFQPRHGNDLVMSEPGEYRVDYLATYTDEAGVLWVASQTWGSVIATPNSPIVTHGSRGSDGRGVIDEIWFSANDILLDGEHLDFPFHNGDIMWMLDTAFDPLFNADVPNVTLQDTQGDFGQRVLDLIDALPDEHQVKKEFSDIEEQVALGEIPLFSANTNGVNSNLQPGASGNHWGYFYGNAARPGVRVREMVTEWDAKNGYWRFDDTYNYQPGVGLKGDLAHDFKFQYGGAVYRVPDDDFFYYGITGSLFVVLPNDDPAGVRVMPPFQGNGGGPSGGPIMNLLGEEIDIFFHPTGIRPGSILEVGDVASFSGAIAPTLPAKATVRVTSPSGEKFNFSGTANRVGYFYRPDQDFVVSEAGRWNVRIRVTHEGRTSAGQLTAPFPQGSVLGGGNEGSFSFYVVDGESGALTTDQPPVSFVRPAEGPIDIGLNLVDDLSNTELNYTVMMPGFLLDQGTTNSDIYSYDSPALSTDFPNLDQFDKDNMAGVDTITMSFLVSGEDGGGNTVYRARQILLQGEELLAPPQLATGPEFQINAGLNDAWFNPATVGQGFFVNVFEELGLMFLAWFTYDKERPDESVEALLGDPGHRWLTAFGAYADHQAVLDIETTSGGVFNATSPAPTQVISGTAIVEFTSCNAGTVSYDIPAIDQQGVVPIQRIALDNVPACEEEDGIARVSKAVTEQFQPGTEKAEGFQINRGLNDAWYDPATAGQGFFVNVFPDTGLVFLAWFTYDVERPDEDVIAMIGEPGHRWLTAFGTYSDNSAELDIEITEGGVFDNGTPATTQRIDGSITLEFTDCNAGTVTFDIPSVEQQGVVEIQRVALDNVPTCEALDGVDTTRQ